MLRAPTIENFRRYSNCRQRPFVVVVNFFKLISVIQFTRTQCLLLFPKFQNMVLLDGWWKLFWDFLDELNKKNEVQPNLDEPWLPQKFAALWAKSHHQTSTFALRTGWRAYQHYLIFLYLWTVKHELWATNTVMLRCLCNFEDLYMLGHSR